GTDLVFIETDILDARKIFVPDAANLIQFSVTGPGRIVGVDNGNPICHESYKSNTRSAFNGKCLLIVQTTKNPGTIEITASANGLDADRIVIKSRP
ncbi:MAG TPA: glycoside hydrolase family 2, partial [Bacillota bacterium]|nr:glycoside hydrolase family 2 [Bacillota bacterium]